MSSPASLDVRLPIGAMFAVDGVILTIYGLVSRPAPEIDKLAGNITLGWGALLIVFGGTMLTFALKGRAATKKT